MPDLYGIKGGVSIWLELKCIKQNSINLSPLQISWNFKHFQEKEKWEHLRDIAVLFVELNGTKI